MEWLSQLAAWSNSNEGLLQVIAMTVAAITVAFSACYGRFLSKSAAGRSSPISGDEPTEAQVSRAIELNPSAASAYPFLGCILQFAGPPRKALTAHETASRLNPVLQSRALALADIALCHLLLGDGDAAVQMARRAVKSDPSNARARQRLVAALGHVGSEEAPRELDDLIASQPGFDSTYVDATYPFRRAEDRLRFITSLEAAGWRG